MPAAFFGHGTPMNALDRNRYTEAWRTFGASIPRPRVILAVSAHWFINASAVTAMSRPRTIHDFYGFPDELFAVDYPAPGDPELAHEIADLVGPTQIGIDTDSWGIDHGTWSVLVHAFPDADIPVIQLSINSTKPFQHHVELGATLAPLRERGVLILGSGNVVHNLARVDWHTPGGFQWAGEFDGYIKRAILEGRRDDVLHYERAGKAASLAFTMPDHYAPLLYALGASDEHDSIRVFNEACVLGSLSMTSYLFG